MGSVSPIMSWVGETGEAKAERSRLFPFPSPHRFQILMSFHVSCCGTLAVSLEAISRLGVIALRLPLQVQMRAQMRAQSFSIGGGKKIVQLQPGFCADKSDQRGGFWLR
jgi:hypothetical protein